MADPQQTSSADAAWLHLDQPTNLTVITPALRFDERVDWSRAREVVRGSRRRMTRRLRVVSGRGETDWLACTILSP